VPGGRSRPVETDHDSAEEEAVHVPERAIRREPRAWLAALLVAAGLGASTISTAAKPRKAGAAAGAARVRSLAETVREARPIPGLVTFYREPDKLYMLLPAELDGAPLGFSAVLVGAAGDFLPRGSSLETQLVRWRRVGDHLVLRKENLDFRGAAGSALAAALEASFADSPVHSAKLVPLSDDPAPLLIDATGLFGPQLAEILSERSGYAARPEDAVLVSLRAFPDNVVARVSYTFRRGPSVAAAGGEAGFARFLRPGRLPDPRSAEIVVDYHFYRLREDGYEPRFADERIGAMTHEYKDYSELDGRDTLFRHAVLRWDVRKADPAAAVSPAAEPITFYLDPSIPAAWRPLVRQGALWWNTAFERVGLRDAVRVLDAPDDPAWDPADLHHSVIYWNLADDLVFSGMAGPSLVDPRTGQVLQANVYLNGEFFSFALNRYLVYSWWRAPEPGAEAELARARRELLAARRGRPDACDRQASFSSQLAFARLVLLARGQLLPGTPEAERFAREAFLELVAHEVGHALGLPHNWKASLVSRWADVRDGRVSGRVDSATPPGATLPLFSASVMDYNPIYLAPRGAAQGDYFLQQLGPYDDLAIEYLYRPLDGLSAAERARELERIASRAETEPGLVYDDGRLGSIDPTSNSDDFGDEPLAFAESRLRVIREELLPRLPELVLAEGHDYSLLRQALDAAIFSVAMDYVDLAARHVGGQVVLRRVAGSAAGAGGPPPIRPVTAALQRQALDVLDREVFADGAFALPPETMALLKADLLPDWNYPWRYASDYHLGSRVAGLYEAALATLLEPARLARVIDNERRVAAAADRFLLPELFERLERSTFGDLAAGPPSADRRALGRALVARLVGLALEPERGTPAEASQLATRSLRRIADRMEAALAREGMDPTTEAHFADLARRARRTLEASIELSID